MHSLETKTPHTALCNLEILFTGNGTSKRAPSSLVLLQRLMSLKYCWLALVPPNSRQWPLGFMHHTPTEGTKPNWTWTPSGDLKWKISKNWRRQPLKDTAFPKWPNEAHTPCSYCCFLLYFLSLFVGRTMPLSTFPNLLQMGETSPTVGCVFRSLDLSKTTNDLDFSVHPISNFAGIPNAAVYLNCSTGPSYKVSVLSPPNLITCFNLIQPCDRKTRSLQYP